MSSDSLARDTVNSYDACKEQGEEALRDRSFDEALDYFQQALKEAPNSAEAYNNIGRTYAEMESWDMAQEAYEEALKIDPSYWKAYGNLAIVFASIQQEVLAIEYVQKALALNPNHSNAYNNLGNFYKKLEQYEEAEKSYKKSLDIEPNSLITKYNYAIFLKNQKRWNEAIALFEEVSIEPPEGSLIGVIRHLVEIYIHLRDENDTSEVSKNLVHYLKRLIDVGSEDKLKEKKLSEEYFCYANMQLGYSYFNLKDYEQASKQLEHCLDFASSEKFEYIYYYLACSYYSMRQFEKALAYCEKIVGSHNENYYPFFTLMGNIYETKGDLESASFYWEKAKK